MLAVKADGVNAHDRVRPHVPGDPQVTADRHGQNMAQIATGSRASARRVRSFLKSKVALFCETATGASDCRIIASDHLLPVFAFCSCACGRMEENPLMSLISDFRNEPPFGKGYVSGT
jgi:hypothetical protein